MMATDASKPNGGVVVAKKDRSLWIEFNRPEVRNAISLGVTTKEVVDALAVAREDLEIRSVVVTGRGPVFCAGGDVKEFAKVLEGGEPEPAVIRESVRSFHAMVEALYNIEKPVIAAINGPAVGAGWSIALACDVSIASERARFSFAFVHRGLTSDGGSTYLLQRAVGYAKAFELIALGDTIDANEALRLGLVSKVVPHEQLVPATEELAARFAAGPPNAMRMIKRALRLASNSSLQDALENEANMQTLCMLGAEHVEGVSSFLEKRPAKF
jgi:2-(1,2-epoxy-1,2-dihydrophenyl)acetyl-CoA isomerase